MPDHIIINPHLKRHDHDDMIEKTFLGQAHIAGTGPKGKTCRECEWWHGHKGQHPGYYSHKHKDKPLEAKKANCNRPIANKPKKRIPHYAIACRLFVENPNPMPGKTDPPPPKPKKEKKTRKEAAR